MELENLVNNILDNLEISDAKIKDNSMSSKLIDIFRRIKKGWLICLLIIAVCVFVGWLLYFPLSKIHSTTTIIGVMFNKEKDANSQGNITNEIVSRITGWTTTTNKYDEIAILTSHIVVGNMLRETGVLDSVYMQYVKKENTRLFQEEGHQISSEDSIKFVNSYVEGFIKKVEAINDQTNIKTNIKTSLITISLEGKIDECGPLLVGLVNSYNNYTRDYNNQLYDNTLRFLDKCIDNLRNDLEKIDNQDRVFREGNLIVDFELQSGEYLNIDREMEDQLRNINLQIQLLSIIRSYMIDMGKEYKVVPANTGIDDEQINRIVIQFNDLVMRRSNFLTSMGEDAMRVQTITNQIEDQRQALIISIDKLTQSFNIRKAKFEKDLHESNARLEKMPNKRITLNQIQRERDIKTPLYKLLQEKYTETLIAKGAEQDQARIITYPYMEEVRKFESPKTLCLLGFLLGILLSSVYLWFLKLPPLKMTLEEAIQKCNLPCWSVFPTLNNREYYKNAMEALLTRIRMSASKKIAITCSYGFEENNLLAEQLIKTLEQQGEKCNFIKWMPRSQNNLAKQIEKFDLSNGYLIIDCGSYHTNPEMPQISQLSDITLWKVIMSVSQLESIDFINYAIKEGIVKKGALVLTDAHIDKKNQVNFGTFDYKTPKFSFARFFSIVSSSDNNEIESKVAKSPLEEEQDVKDDDFSSSKQAVIGFGESSEVKQVSSHFASGSSLGNFWKKWWWLVLLLVLVPLGFAGGYILSADFSQSERIEQVEVLPSDEQPESVEPEKPAAPKKEISGTKQSVTAVSPVATKQEETKANDKVASDVKKASQAKDNELHEKYAAMDKRVRLGAYKIVGLDKEVTVRDGDNVESFSSRYLGPGMSCYIEVFNGIKADTPLKAGQMLKIPKLVKKIKQNK